MKVNFKQFDKECENVIDDSLVIMALFNVMCLQYVSDTELPPYGGSFLVFKETISEELFDKLSDGDFWNIPDDDSYFYTRGEIIIRLKDLIN
jgi:hypothetical protein